MKIDSWTDQPSSPASQTPAPAAAFVTEAFEPARGLHSSATTHPPEPERSAPASQAQQSSTNISCPATLPGQDTLRAAGTAGTAGISPSSPAEDEDTGPLILEPANPEPLPLATQPARGEQQRILNAQRRADTIAAYDALIARGLTPKAAQRTLKREAGISTTPITIWRWKKALAKTGDLKPKHHLSGRRPAYLPTEPELALVRKVWQRMDHTSAGGSDIAAFRIVARSADPCVTDDFRRVVLKRQSKTIPPSWQRLLDTPQSVVQYARDPKTLHLNFINTPRNRTWVDAQGVERPLEVGSIFESDDGTVNFPCWVPWPFGGDPCSEKFHVRVGRYQLLPIVDVHSGFCPAWHFVIRPKASYRGEDAMALFGDLFTTIGRPQSLRLERGSWESQIVRNSLQLAAVPVHNAWLSKHKAVVEGFFNRLWDPLSLVPGHVGRDRDRYTQVTDLLLECQAGKKDPRDHFLSYEQATRALEMGVGWANAETKEHPHWGRWIPEQRWHHGRGPVEARRLHPEMRCFFMRDQHDWTVRGHCVGGKVSGPMITFEVYFQDPALWEFEGCKVRAYFDAYAEPCLGTLVLQDEWRTYKPGHIIARDIPALDRPPQIVLCADWEGQEKYQRSLDIRKQIATYVRTEAWNWLGGRTSQVRDGAARLLEARNVSAVPLLENGKPNTDSSPSEAERLAALADAALLANLHS